MTADAEDLYSLETKQDCETDFSFAGEILSRSRYSVKFQ